jgi:hypothetical protein
MAIQMNNVLMPNRGYNTEIFSVKQNKLAMVKPNEL